MFPLRLSHVFLQSATMPPINLQFFGIIIILGRGIMLLLRINLGISSGCHHTTPTPKKFRLYIIV